MTADPKWPLVLVRWLDHTSDDSWRHVDEHDSEPHICMSAGWLIKETEKYIAVAGSCGDGDVCCVMNIVKSCILEQRTL